LGLQTVFHPGLVFPPHSGLERAIKTIFSEFCGQAQKLIYECLCVLEKFSSDAMVLHPVLTSSQSKVQA
jgi:hypothetical protein